MVGGLLDHDEVGFVSVTAFGPDDGEVTGVQPDPAIDEVAVVGDEGEVPFSGAVELR